MQNDQTVLTVEPATDHFAQFILLRATNKHEPSEGGGGSLSSCLSSSLKKIMIRNEGAN